MAFDVQVGIGRPGGARNKGPLAPELNLNRIL